MTRNKGGSILSKFFYLSLQLIVVFAGVYGAFLLDQKREKENQKKKAAQVYEYFINETESIESSRKESEMYDSAINEFFNEYKNGKMPELIDYHSPFFTSYLSSTIWISVMNSGGIEVIDFETIARIDYYMNQRGYLLKIMELGNEYQKALVLPNYEKGKFEFYDFKTKRLKPKYYWFIDFLKSIQLQLKAIMRENQEINKLLKEKLEQLKRNE